MLPFEYLATPSEFARTHLFHALLCGYEQTVPSFHFKRDHYPAYEILIITNGKGWFTHGTDHVELAQGDCLLHDMRYPHAYRANSDDPYGMYYLVFDGLDTEQLWRRFFRAPYVLSSYGSQDSPLMQTLQGIAMQLENENNPDEAYVSASIYLLLLQFYQSFTGNTPDGGSVKRQSMEAAKSFIDSRFADISEIREVADQANLSLYHFIRQFKKAYGFTPKEYLLFKKVHHAKRLLLLTDLSMNEIALRCGFPNYNSFLHSFLKIEQLSPTSYRKNWRKRPF